MAKKTVESNAVDELRTDIKAGTLKRVYAFFGEERYLLETYLNMIRKTIPTDTAEFNHRRIDGKSFDINELAETVDAFPVFAETTLTEVTDLDISKMDDGSRAKLVELLTDVPEYACVIFVFDTVEYKLDGRIKTCRALRDLITPVEFCLQDQAKLIKWIFQHIAAEGKKIDREAAEHLIFVTGGLMTTIAMEINKLISYCTGDAVTVKDIDAVVTPVLDAAAYEMTDALISGNGNMAVKKLGELIMMNEAPQKIVYSLSAKLRQLLCAKICVDAGMTTGEFMKICDIRFDFQAKALVSAARRTSLSSCKDMVTDCAETAYLLNSAPQDSRELLEELMFRLLMRQRSERA